MHRGWLGVRIQAVTDEIAESLGLDKARGALIASVNDNGPAQAAGIQPGDVVLTFDGKAVNDMRRLPRLVAETPVDKTVTVDRLAQAPGEPPFKVKVGELDESDQQQARRAASRPRRPTRPGRHRQDARPDPLEHHAGAQGEVFARRRCQGRRRRRGRQGQPGGRQRAYAGRLIMEAAQEEVKSPGEISGKIDEAKKSGRKSILLLVDRQGDLRFVALRLDSRMARRTASRHLRTELARMPHATISSVR